MLLGCFIQSKCRRAFSHAPCQHHIDCVDHASLWHHEANLPNLITLALIKAHPRLTDDALNSLLVKLAVGSAQGMHKLLFRHLFRAIASTVGLVPIIEPVVPIGA